MSQRTTEGRLARAGPQPLPIMAKVPRMKNRVLLAVVGIAAAGMLVACSLFDPDDESGPVEDAEESVACDETAQSISTTLSSGVTWAMCWGVDPQQGLMLSDIHVAAPGGEPVQLMESLSIAQLEVPYDTGERSTFDITSAGFGGRKMHTLTEDECTGDRIAIAVPDIGDGSFGDSPEREVLCSEVKDGGLAYRSHDGARLTTDRKDEWRLWTISKVGWYEYITQYTFGADGSITPSLGATGDLSPVDYTDERHGWDVGSEHESEHAANHSHNVVWKVHWALAGGEDVAVEQFDAERTGELGPKSPVLDGRLTRIERPATALRADRRWWRVINPAVENDDGHPISYQIDVGATDSFTFTPDEEEHGHEAGYDIAFTNHDECQVFASKNRGSCGAGVLDYVAQAQDHALEDVVAWVAVGYHHVPRDEEQSPMELHWQGFSMIPRDLTAQRMDLPEGRGDVNGRPEEYEGPIPE